MPMLEGRCHLEPWTIMTSVANPTVQLRYLWTSFAFVQTGIHCPFAQGVPKNLVAAPDRSSVPIDSQKRIDYCLQLTSGARMTTSTTRPSRLSFKQFVLWISSVATITPTATLLRSFWSWMRYQFINEANMAYSTSCTRPQKNAFHG